MNKTLSRVLPKSKLLLAFSCIILFPGDGLKSKALNILENDGDYGKTIKAGQKVPALLDISLEQFHSFFVSGNIIIVDARPQVFYNLGHVPRSMSIPRERFQDSYSKVRLGLEANKDRLIVVYCFNVSCADSLEVGLALHDLGFKQVCLFRGGWSEWSGSGYPMEKSL